MRYKILWIAIIAAIVMFAITLPITAQMNQVCGAGLMIRADGSIIIDSYTIYPLPFPGSAPNQQSTDGKPHQGPTSVTLGKSLDGNVPVCIESGNGSHCVSLQSIRNLK